MKTTARQISIGVALGFAADDVPAMRLKWATHRGNALRRGLVSALSFAQYCSLARDAGITHSSDIGINPGCYQLGRFGDVGAYTVKNCRFITAEQNRIECDRNGGYRAGGSKQKGRSKLEHEYLRECSVRLARYFLAVGPQGTKVLGRNVTSFCREFGLNQGRLSFLARTSSCKLHKGWSLKYLDAKSFNRLAGKPNYLLRLADEP